PGATLREAAPAWVQDAAAEVDMPVVVVATAAVVADTDNRSSYYVAESAKCELERLNAANHAEFRRALLRYFS
ncbi:MAG: hypothetical protein WCD15_08385, partial [Terriglobales bacterium]